MRVAITGATGFVGSHLSKYLEGLNYEVVRVTGDLREPEFAWQLHGCDHVYALAANMGGRGFITRAPEQILLDNVQIATNTMRAAREVGARVLFVSSACVYPAHIDGALKEDDAYPAAPDETYGWSKLVGEKIFEQYEHARIVRMDSVYGVGERWRGGREKVLPALCRKAVQAHLDGRRSVEVFGTGKESRAFLHVTDAVRAFERLIWADYRGAVNLGSERETSIEELVGIISRVAGWPLSVHPLGGPTGKARRVLDISRLKEIVPAWEQKEKLEFGVSQEYAWIEREMK